MTITGLIIGFGDITTAPFYKKMALLFWMA
jgi:hypothetical protein